VAGLAESSSQIKILDKTLKVLLLFGEEQPEWGVTAISRAADMPKSTAHRIVTALERLGFLTQDEDTRRFRLGLTALELARRAYRSIAIRQVAAPVLERLARESEETVLLEVLSPTRDRVVCIERAQQRSGLRLILEVGSTAPLHAGSSSKVLLAYLSPEEIEEVIARGLARLTPHTITDPDRLRAELVRVKRNGYATSFEETDEGAVGVSVPIHDYLGRVVAGLTIAGPITRVNERTMGRYLDLAREGAGQIEAKLGHQEPSPSSNGHAAAAK
jgi:DNA-binding IclR family transcriptional regulator